ncbi:DNA cytosine methyltransferase [Paludibacterium paludis]|uniref:Cytosine-specific methyltransferase n=1 Tax=Paludibacterium paludis TaxID=1225769 RepID=A0A918UA55_9NEIS|nr:DNA (cytosine-5-)-methyltransferase [Paludibacterium paludis]GGY19468.1 hypothetical protein GCM10011289_23790 [Paludibacterium paludis]
MDFLPQGEPYDTPFAGAVTRTKSRPPPPSRSYKFVDLFAGLGGFHVGLENTGHQCVFSCELDDGLRDLYHKNFGLLPEGDIRNVDEKKIPAHEILCAGFPCQPFSLAGKKKGAACPESGKLIDDVFRIIRHHNPKYVLLENVPNVLTIANGSFWQYIKDNFKNLGYEVQYKIYSPTQFGLPQQRLRLFVVASRTGLEDFSWPAPKIDRIKPIYELINSETKDARPIEPGKLRALEKWNETIRRLENFSSLTIIASEFGATYPLEGLPNEDWNIHAGAFGTPLSNYLTREDAIQALPHYASKNENGAAPKWMHSSIKYSRSIYEKHKDFFDIWKQELKEFPNSWQKFEWRGDRKIPDIWQHTIQFRASGIRVMKPEMAPSLIAMTTTQIPIVGRHKRYLEAREAATLQALDGLKFLPSIRARAFKALGNAVNAHIVEEIAKRLL